MNNYAEIIEKAGFSVTLRLGVIKVEPAEKLTDAQKKFIDDHRGSIYWELLDRTQYMGYGGQLPDYLKKPTETELDEVIGPRKPKKN